MACHGISWYRNPLPHPLCSGSIALSLSVPLPLPLQLPFAFLSSEHVACLLFIADGDWKTAMVLQCMRKTLLVCKSCTRYDLLASGPIKAAASKINKKTVEAHRALQGGLVNLGQALAEGHSPAQLREVAASQGLRVQGPLRVNSGF